jgi:curved DNA-binding protein CbpA
MPLLKDYYAALEVDKNASADAIKKAYFKKAKQYHPDVNKSAGAKERFSEINEAYETLGDDSKKRVYDMTGMTSDE